MRKKSLIIILFLVLIFSKPVFAADIPQPTGWVNDFANVISPEYRDKLTKLIQELEEKTTDEITVVSVQSIAPYDETQYARMIFDNWKIGKKGKDNGVLVLLAIKERRWRIETGYGVEGILPDGLCGEIGRGYMVPYFKQGKYAEGLYYGVVAIAKVILKDANISIPDVEKIRLEKQREKTPFFVYIFVPLFFLIWNLPWPIYIGLPFTLLFAISFFQISPIAGIMVIIGYILAQLVRYNDWRKLPLKKRKNFFWAYTYGGSFSSGHGGGFGGGGFGGFGGGGGGGGGAGGGF